MLRMLAIMPTNMPQKIVQNMPASKTAEFFQKVYTRVYGWLGSQKFFYIIVALLVFQALWIALTARYPQAFDENYHFGLIRLHAEQWLPYFTSHPPGGEVYGAVSRDPSYLFHFLFSLPYRLLATATDSVAVQVISLRLANVALFVGGLLAYRKLLAELKISRRITNVVLFFFVLTPIMPLLAGQINYDNLIFLLTGLLFYVTVKFLRRLREHDIFDGSLLLQILVYILFAGLVKYTSTPLSLALMAIILFVVVRHFYRTASSFRDSIVWPKKVVLLLLVTLVLLLGGLSLERYGVNLARYHTPVPDCADVLTVEQCKSYSPWVRDYIYSQSYPKPSAWGVFVYPGVWAHRMVFETMFTVSSRFASDGTVEYQAEPPLTVANYTAWTLTVVGAVLMLYYLRRLWRLVYLRYLLLAIIFYTLTLFAKNFSMYLHTGEAMAIHGRYLIPVFPVIYAAIALVFALFADHRLYRPQVKTWLVIVTFLLLLQGAGIITWIMQSDSRWYWQQSSPSQTLNRTTQNVLEYLIVK